MKRLAIKRSKKGIAFKVIMIIIAMIATSGLLYINVNTNEMWMSQVIAINVYGFICCGLLIFCLLIDKRLKGHDFDSKKSWLFFLVLYAISLLVMIGCSHIKDGDFRFICIIPMLFSLCYDIRYGFLTTIIFSSLFELVSGETVEYMVLLMLVGAVSSLAARLFTKIKTLVAGIICTLLASYVVNILFYFMLNEEIDLLLGFRQVTGVAIAVVIIVVFALIYKPTKQLLKWDLNKETYLKNLSASDNPAYIYMKNSSIPVFNHANDVMELAVIGAKSIGINESLVKAGALYHDIGKCESTDYIKIGVAIAKKFKMPEAVIRIIKEHNVSVKLPTTKECAVVMLADSVISSFDYLMEKNPGKKIDKTAVINSVFANRLDKGCLNDSGLTLEDFTKVKQSFIDWMTFSS